MRTIGGIPQDCKAEMTSRQPCIDFLNHSVEEKGFVDDTANRNERLTLAEQLGALNLDWILLQRKIDLTVGTEISYWDWTLKMTYHQLLLIYCRS